ncbi:MAG: sulfotransferase, partial [Woeseiaceae bacterium]
PAQQGLKALQKPIPEMGSAGTGPGQQQVELLMSLFNQGRLQDAISRGEGLATEFPEVPFIANLLGAACFSLGRLQQAETHFRRALELKPDYAVAHNNLGNALKSLGMPLDAVASYQKATDLSPGYLAAHKNLAAVLNSLGEYSAALESLQTARQINPESAEVHNDIGVALSVLGNVEQAMQSFETALEIRPDYAEAHRNLSEVRAYQSGDLQIEQMQTLLRQGGQSAGDTALLNFALGKACGDIGEYDRAFSCIAAGNRLLKDESRYDISNDQKIMGDIKARFASDVAELSSVENSDQTSQRPIFILGMPRSGTSLVEQILASHSQVYGAGEIGLLGQAVEPRIQTADPLQQSDLEAIRASYLSGLAEFAGKQPFVTDKLPSNFLRIGFIRAALPDARIIHVIRDARATCWSIYKNYFSGGGNDFSHDLVDVAEYYNLYCDLMSFWHERYPGEIYDLNYESLTENQSDESRRLIDYLGLEWEEQCLEFHKSERAVRTASFNQVRQEMYQGSSEAWRNYKKYIGPMLEILGAGSDSRPD